MTTTAAPECPICGGAMWDDRAQKTNAKAPDFKCKNKPKEKGGPGCEGVIWPPKNGAPYKAAPASTAKQAFSAGPVIPGLDDVPVPFEKLNAIFNLYDACFQHAHGLAVRTYGPDASPVAIAAQAATIFIAAKDRGIAA